MNPFLTPQPRPGILRRIRQQVSQFFFFARRFARVSDRAREYGLYALVMLILILLMLVLHQHRYAVMPDHWINR